MSEKNYLGVRITASWGPQWPIGYILTNWIQNVGDDHMWTRAGGNHEWDANLPVLDGAYVIVLDGTEFGRRLHIVKSDHVAVNTDEIHFEEDIANDFPGLAATDRLAIFCQAMAPGVEEDFDADDPNATIWTEMDEFFGIVDEGDVPDWAQEVYSLFSHGDSMPVRRSSIAQKKVAEATIPLIVTNPRLLFFGNGYVQESGTAGVGVDTLATVTYPGEWLVDITSGTGFTNADYVEFGDNAAGAHNEGTEIRQIVSGSAGGAGAETWVLDRPLRRFHPAGAGVQEVTGPYTHTIRGKKQWASWPIRLHVRFDAYDKFANRDDVRVAYCGVHLKKMGFDSTVDAPLTCSVDMTSIDQFTDSGTAIAAVDESDYPNDPYHWRQASIYIDSVQFRQAETMKGEMVLEGDTKHYHDAGRGIKPFEFIAGRKTASVETTIPYHNSLLVDHIYDADEFDFQANFNRGTDDTIDFYWTDCRAEEAKRSMPTEGAIPQNIKMNAAHLRIIVVDDIPYY